MPILERFSLQGKVALVTGGAGIFGRQIVQALAEAGARTYMASRDLAASEQAASEHRATGCDVVALTLDQSDEKSVLALRDEIAGRGNAIDVLVNNAVARPMKSYDDDVAAFARSMEINATGLFSMTRAFGDVMAQNGGGSIININSIYGLVAPDPSNYAGTELHGWLPDYAFHKGGMTNFTRFVASYYGARGVRCNGLSAGGFYIDQPEPFLTQYCAHTMLGRMAGESDLMGAIVFLASDASAYLTGATIPIDGGYTAK